jgi:esterase/lipase superfamily enzyme
VPGSSHLTPPETSFVFGWPTGTVLSYFQATGQGASGATTSKMFAAFLRELAESGIRQVHILAHSMGAKVLLSALDEMKSVFCGGEGALSLSTCVLMNPDSFLDEFKESQYQKLRAMTDHITLYADRDDGALLWSEVVNRGGAGGGRLGGRKALGMNPDDLGGLDMDVVDTSWMDANVHNIRHNIFNLNRWVIDDLREIFTERKRARQRSSRMMKRERGGVEGAEENVFVFLAAPAHVVND